MVKPSPSEPLEPSRYGVTPIPDGSKRGWTVTVNGEDITQTTSHADLTHEKLGLEVKFGQRPEGYDGVVIREPGGGGAVTIPYMVTEEGLIYVGVVIEDRPTLGGKVKNIPRGLLQKDETHAEGAVREGGEETGDKIEVGRLTLLAAGLNPNPTYFDTSRSETDGVSIYAYDVGETKLVLNYDNEGNVFYNFSPEITANVHPDVNEKIFGTMFIPIEDAMVSRDMITAAAAGQLFARLRKEFRYIVPQDQPVRPVEELSER